MKSIRYLKVVLTMIAVCLVLICLRDVSLVGTASAWGDAAPGRYQVTGDGKGLAFRLDSLSGQVCTYVVGAKDFESCTSPGK